VTGRRYALGVTLAAATALVLGGIGLTREPLRDDELLTLAIAGRPLGEFINTLPQRQNGILFDVVLWPIVHAGGLSEAWLRLPALLAFVAAVVLCAFVGRRLVGKTVGLVGAWLLAVNPFAITYAQDARPYSFVLFFAIASVLALLRALERPSVLRWLVYAATVVGLGYSHDFAILSVLAHPVLVAGHGRRAWRGHLGALAVSGVAMIPLVLFIPDDWGATALDWVPPAAGAGVDTATGFAGGWAGLVVAVVALALGLLALTRIKKPAFVRSFRRLHLFLAIWLLGPVTVLALVSVYRDVLVPRYVIQSLPALCLAIAVSQIALPRRLGLGLVIVVGATFLASTIANTVGRSHADWPGVARYVARSATPGEVVVTFGSPTMIANGLFYYAPELGVARDRLLWFGDRERVPPHMVLFDSGDEHDVNELVELARGKPGLWLVRTPAQMTESAQRSLAQLTERCDSTFVKFRGVDVLHVPRCA
jgi:mannosyltransferase